MMDSSPKDVTRLLVQWRSGDEEALNQLMPIVFDELHRLAGHYMRRERSDHTLQATALVHEAYLRLVKLEDIQWQDRAHFFAVAAQMMRRVLVNYAKRHRAAKRNAGRRQVVLDEATVVSQERPPDVMALDDALNSLAAFDRLKSQIIELKFFGGLTIEETAEALGVSRATIERELKMAKAWLYHEISEGGASDE